MDGWCQVQWCFFIYYILFLQFAKALINGTSNKLFCSRYVHLYIPLSVHMYLKIKFNRQRKFNWKEKNMKNHFSLLKQECVLIYISLFYIQSVEITASSSWPWNSLKPNSNMISNRKNKNGFEWLQIVTSACLLLCGKLHSLWP